MLANLHNMFLIFVAVLGVLGAFAFCLLVIAAPINALIWIYDKCFPPNPNRQLPSCYAQSESAQKQT